MRCAYTLFISGKSKAKSQEISLMWPWQKKVISRFVFSSNNKS